MLQPSLSFTSFYFCVLLKRGPFVYVVFKDSLETKILERANQKNLHNNKISGLFPVGCITVCFKS